MIETQTNAAWKLQLDNRIKRNRFGSFISSYYSIDVHINTMRYALRLHPLKRWFICKCSEMCSTWIWWAFNGVIIYIYIEHVCGDTKHAMEHLFWADRVAIADTSRISTESSISDCNSNIRRISDIRFSNNRIELN